MRRSSCFSTLVRTFKVNGCSYTYHALDVH
nr:MAG TPA: hypothetical protein [Caudoviricetes sp.]